VSKPRIVLGARVPVILTSRADSPQAPHIVSCDIALLLGEQALPAGQPRGGERSDNLVVDRRLRALARPTVGDELDERASQVTSSTGTPDAVKVACPVWTGGKSVSSYLSLQDREILPILRKSYHTSL